jgi:hypothetical protein
MKTTLILSALAGLCAVVPLSLQAQSVLIDFSSSTSIADTLTKDTVNTGGTSGGYGSLTHSTTAGLNSSGAAATPVKFTDNYGYTTKASFTPSFSTFTISTSFFLGSSWETGTSLVLNLGVTSAANPLVGSGKDGSNVDFGTVGIPTNAQSSMVNTLRFSGTGASPAANITAYSNGSVTTSTSSSATLTLSNWYKVETVFTHTSGDIITFSTSLFLTDSTGTISGNTLVQQSGTASNASLLAATDLYGYIGSQNGNRRGITTIDNLSFAAVSNVPEPASYGAILGLLGLAGAITLRRSRRN